MKWRIDSSVKTGEEAAVHTEAAIEVNLVVIEEAVGDMKEEAVVVLIPVTEATEVDTEAVIEAVEVETEDAAEIEAVVAIEEATEEEAMI